MERMQGEGGVEDLLRLAELVRTAERLGLLGDTLEVLGIDARLERDAVGAVQLDVCIDALRPEELLGLRLELLLRLGAEHPVGQGMVYLHGGR